MNGYRLGMKSISDLPVAGLGAGLSQNVVFHIDSEDGLLSADRDGGSMRGEELDPCSHTQEKGKRHR